MKIIKNISRIIRWGITYITSRIMCIFTKLDENKVVFLSDVRNVLGGNLKETVDDYDMIYSGDLGIYGKEILKEYMKENYGIDLKNYNDTATMIYDVKHQDVYSGGSGPNVILKVATRT